MLVRIKELVVLSSLLAIAAASALPVMVDWDAPTATTVEPESALPQWPKAARTDKRMVDMSNTNAARMAR